MNRSKGRNLLAITKILSALAGVVGFESSG
jgi:hypothetical protein